jgi:hypothetical protein
MAYYGQPAPLAAGTEDQIIATVRSMLPRAFLEGRANRVRQGSGKSRCSVLRAKAEALRYGSGSRHP